MTDEKGMILGAKSADHCVIRSVSVSSFCIKWYDTDLGKDLPFGNGADLRMSA
jgi:hypothetical protein